MPAHSTAFQNSVLDGTFRSDMAADDYVVRAWFDNPAGVDPTEADFTGYTPPTVAKADWAAAEGGVIQTTALVSFGTPTTDASDALRYVSFHDSVTDELAYSTSLRAEVYVTAGSNPVRLALTVPYGFNN